MEGSGSFESALIPDSCSRFRTRHLAGLRGVMEIFEERRRLVLLHLAPAVGLVLHLLNFSRSLGPSVPPRLCSRRSLLPLLTVVWKSAPTPSPPAKCSPAQPASPTLDCGGLWPRGWWPVGTAASGDGRSRGKPVPPRGRESPGLPRRAKGPPSQMQVSISRCLLVVNPALQRHPFPPWLPKFAVRCCL